jgi:glycosyltransferase involved in cell wall biosynthesis
VFSGDLWAGAEVVILNLLAALRDDPGLRVLAVSLNEGTLTERLRASGITTHVISEARHSLLGIVRQAAALLRHQRVAILHSHRYKENVLAWLLARSLGVSETVTTIHGVSEASKDSRLERWIARGRRGLDYFLVKRTFSSVIAVSDEMKRVLVAKYGFRESQIRVIRNGAGLPTQMPEPVFPRGILRVGTVGRLVPVKGLDLFLEVASVVRRQIPTVRFSILGEGPLHAELTRRAAELHLGDGMEFLAPRPDPFAYYRSLDVYLNTSRHEGLPLSVVEAMACGTPVISAAVGGIPEIVTDGEHGFLVQGREPARFAERCLTLLRDDRLRARMGERAAATARTQLSAQAMAAAYRRLYEECATRLRARDAVAGAARTAPLAGMTGTRR